MPGAGFGRELTLASRRGEYGELPKNVTQRATDIYLAEWQPRLARLAPWLSDMVSVG